MRRLCLQTRCADIEATVTSDAAVADAWVRGLRASHPRGAPLVVGLDCKWNRQPTRSPAWMAPKAAVLQLYAGGGSGGGAATGSGSGSGCLVLQLLYLRRVPETLREFLRDPRVRLVGVGVAECAARLAAEHGLVCAAPVELAGPCDAYLGLVGSREREDKLGLGLGLKEYAKKVLDLNLEKPEAVGLSDWEKRDLDVNQIGYACVDAYVSYRLGDKVLSGR